MMVIYLPVNFEYDWTKRFRVRVRKWKMLTDRQTDKKRTNEKTGMLGHPVKVNVLDVLRNVKLVI